jgi:crotonobetainyl-CoA:carnitine CoA-transferase CaiB-like acyl-CoA transferase
MRDRCAVLDWAASGAMALTGMPEGIPVASPAPALARLDLVCDDFARVTRESGTEVRADPAELIAGRAALAGLTRGGQVSAGGSSFLLRATDGWCAITVSRPDDIAAVPAMAGVLGLDSAELDGAELDSADLASLAMNEVETRAQARSVLTALALGTTAADFAAAAQLVGVPAAALPARARPPTADMADTAPSAGGARATEGAADSVAAAAAAGWPPWRTKRIAASVAGATLNGAVVADLSSMWAGPVCARLLGLAGATVIKVESPARPDGARSGNREFFDWLHAGHRSLSVDFGTRAGRTVLAELLEVADVVIEASRPRALAAAGLAPDMIPHRPGQVWLSITGYGRALPDRVAFGDDAAVSGGLVGWTTVAGYGGASPREGRSPVPVFCADAIADPLTGACGALAVARSLTAGGGELIDLSMRDVAAAFAAAPLDHGPHDILPGRSATGPRSHQVLPGGSVTCPRSGREQAVMPPRRPAPPAGAAAHAAELGADTSAVLAWLAGRRTPC